MIRRLDFEPKWFVVGIFFLAGSFIGVLGLFIWLFNGGSILDVQKIHPAKSNYKFINPLLAVDTFEKKSFLEALALRNKVSALIDREKSKNNIKEASVYYRDIEPGRWVGINERNNFSPGNLLKIPIVMAYFKASESSPGLLNKMLVFNGTPVKIEELIKTMILDDDTDAANFLFDNIDKNSLDEIYSDLGIEFVETKENSDYISIKDYSLIIRFLYNATYLNRENSEKALELLSETTPGQGIDLGLEKDLIVAHKYRTRTYLDKDRTFVEAHDCGIVYFPNHPYLLCMSSVGENKEAVDNLFKEVGQLTYQDMKNNYK